MPTSPLHVCPYPGCTTLVAKSRCDAHSGIQQRRHGHAEDRRFYDSAQWKRVRAMKLGRDPLCQYCLAAGRNTDATEVDHYVPIAAGGSRTHDDNLVSACRPCHSRKTGLEQQGQAPPAHSPSAPATYGFA